MKVDFTSMLPLKMECLILKIIPSGRNIKKALTLEEIAKIYNYSAIERNVDDMCRDYWIFIYLCNGLNVKDFCLLTYKNIEGDFIVFDRAKTILTRHSNPEPIRIALKEDAKRIIEKWGQKETSPDTFIFPYLNHAMTAEQQRAKIQLLVHLINEHMKIIAHNLGINKPITTYYARHSFATILKNSGVSTEFISEAWGTLHWLQPKIIWPGLSRMLSNLLPMCWCRSKINIPI